MKSKISVVIPTKNRPEFLERLLKPFSDFANNIQLIVVDDGSYPVNASQNKQICSHFPRSDYNYFPISKGAPNARNLGLSKCLFEFVWFIDDDDQVLENTIHEVLQQICVASSDVFLLPMKVMYNDLVLGTNVPVTKKQNYEKYRKDGHHVNTSCAIIRKQRVIQIGGWDEKLLCGQDTSLFLLLSQICSFKYIETEPVIVNVGHSKRIGRQVFKQQLAKVQFLKKHWSELSFRRRAYYVLSFVFVLPAFYPLRLRLSANIAKKAIKKR